MDKCKMTDEVKTFDGHILHRIVALKDFGVVKKGDLGGWIETYDNLSCTGNCWIFDDAMVYGDAKVCGNAHIFGNARIFGNAHIFDSVLVYDNAQVYGNAEVHDEAEIYNNAKIYGNARVRDDTEVFDSARIYGNAQIFDSAVICNNAVIYGDAQVCGAAKARGFVTVCDGRWNKTPLYIEGTRFAFNVAGPDEVRCGCQIHTFQEWHDKYEEIAKEHRADDIIEEYVRYFNLACKMYGYEDCIIKEVT